MASFPSTRYSVVAAIRSDAADERRSAFDALAAAYWKPVFKYVRLKWRASPDEAADLTQGFFLRAFEKNFFAPFDPARARFRTFLRTCLDGFVANTRKADARLKRGGGVTLVPIAVAEAERELQAQTANAVDDFDAYFHREWLRALFAAAAEPSARTVRRPRPSVAIRALRAATTSPTMPTRARPTPRSRTRSAARPPTSPTSSPPRAASSAVSSSSCSASSAPPTRSSRPKLARSRDDLRAGARSPRRHASRAGLRGTRYELRSILGRGGMGVVYLAHDTVLDREVALKVVDRAGHAGRLRGDTPDVLAAEARILARLEHPGIVPVHDFGELPDGRLFYAMKRVRGERLDRWLTAGRGIAERLAVFLRVCDAVAFAHAHGVVHRDLKPENVMVGDFGEVLVLDWGIARVPRAQRSEQRPQRSDQTSQRVVAGTPDFMAPEQQRGDADVDHRADIHALGIMLALLGDPPPLAAIARKASAADRDARYQTINALTADVNRYLPDHAVEAHRERMADRLARVWRRYKLPILLVATYLVVRLLLIWLAEV